MSLSRPLRGACMPPYVSLLTHLGRFGAVMEEFEVRDAISAVFSTKPELNMAF